MPTVTGQFEFPDYIALSDSDRERLDLLASAGAIEERVAIVEGMIAALSDTTERDAWMATVEERLATIGDHAAIEERLATIEEKLAAIADPAALDARFAALDERISALGDTDDFALRLGDIEANLTAVADNLTSLQGKFDAAGKLLGAVLPPTISADKIADSTAKVMMTPLDRVALGRLRPVDLATPIANGVAKGSMFVRYTGNADGRWTLDPSVHIALIENHSQPPSKLTLIAPPGLAMETTVVLLSRYAANVNPEQHTACVKRAANSMTFRV